MPTPPYIIFELLGVVKDSVGVQCAPAQSINDPNFVEYMQWVAAGNQPIIDNTTSPDTPRTPNPSQFIVDGKTILGGLSTLLTNPNLANLSLMINASISAEQWTDVEQLIVSSHTAGLITDEQYVAIATSADANNIPISL